MVEEKNEDKEKKAAARKKPAAKKQEEKPQETKKDAKQEETTIPVVKEEKKAQSVTDAAPKEKRKKGAKKSGGASTKAFVVRGKRKKSVARASISAGKGVVRFNNCNISALQNKYVREIIIEPLRYIGPEANTVNISVSVYGGGMMGQAQAARTAIANALVMYFDDQNLKTKFTEIDRSLVIEDTRRVESKKFRGPKARARYQKSYR